MSVASYEEPCKISGAHCTFETAGLILADSARPHYRLDCQLVRFYARLTDSTGEQGAEAAELGVLEQVARRRLSRSGDRRRVSTLTTRLEGCRMVGPFTSLYSCEESLPIQVLFATYRARSARVHRGKNNRSVTRPAKGSLGGFPVIRTCS